MRTRFYGKFFLYVWFTLTVIDMLKLIFGEMRMVLFFVCVCVRMVQLNFIRFSVVMRYVE